MYLCVHVCECGHENLPCFISKRIWKITITIFEVTTKNFFLRFCFFGALLSSEQDLEENKTKQNKTEISNIPYATKQAQPLLLSASLTIVVYLLQLRNLYQHTKSPEDHSNHSWQCILYGFREMNRDKYISLGYYIEHFYFLKILCSPAIHPSPP